MKYKEPVTGREEPAFDNLLVVEPGEQRILSQLHFFQRKYSPELARLPAELEYKRVWRREKHPSPPETDLDPGLADVQQVTLFPSRRTDVNLPPQLSLNCRRP